jgi:alpha-1,2-mannosyltransferase
MKYLADNSTPRQRRWVQAALIAWAALAVALCIKVLVEGNQHSVYGAFVTGPRGWWAGATMYTDRGYYYSPTFSVLFTPFAIFPDRIGQMLWGLTSVGLLVWSLRVFYRDVLPSRWPRETEAAFLALTLAGSLRGIWSLQSNTVLMACILFAAAALVRYRFWRAAWWFAAPVYIKVWPIVAAGLIGVHWPRKLLPRLLIALVAFAALPFATKAPGAVVNYYSTWLDRLANRQITVDRFTGYRDAWTIWEQFSSPVNKHAFFLLQAGAGLAVFGFSLWLRKQQRSTAEFLTMTLFAWAAWQLLFGPGTERLTYLIIAPFAAWAAITSHYARKDLWLAAVGFITTFILGAGGVERILIRLFPSAVALQPIGVVLLVAWLVRYATYESVKEHTLTTARGMREPHSSHAEDFTAPSKAA